MDTRIPPLDSIYLQIIFIYLLEKIELLILDAVIIITIGMYSLRKFQVQYLHS